MNLESAFDFLRSLNQNNDRTWFEAHRPWYEDSKRDVEAFFFSLFSDLELERGNQKPSFWFHRIYRDVRFARGKGPYKPWFSAVLDSGGRKGPGLKTYLHLQPGGESIVGGGLWQPELDVLKRFRADMEDGPRAFLKILDSAAFRSELTLVDDRLKNVPRGYPADHPAADLLRLKQVVAWRHFSDSEVLASNFGPAVVKTAQALRPFLDYLNESVGIVALPD